MANKVFRETLEGAVRLDGWLSDKPNPKVPRVIVPNCTEWLLGVDDFVAKIAGPAIILINIGLTALPEDLQRQIVALASREDLAVWVHIRTSDNNEVRRAFIRQVSDSRVTKYTGAIPGLGEALEALA